MVKSIEKKIFFLVLICSTPRLIAEATYAPSSQEVRATEKPAPTSQSSQKTTPSNVPKAKTAHDCYKPNHPLCAAIKKLQPRLSDEEAFKLSTVFKSVAKEYTVPAPLLASIAMQESAFKLSTVRRVKGLIKQPDGTYSEGVVVSDVCMMQINAFNIIKLELETEKLLTDPKYCIQAGAKILASFKAKQQREANWWTRYNAVSKMHRQIYQNHVMRHWRKLDPLIDAQNNQVQQVVF